MNQRTECRTAGAMGADPLRTTHRHDRNVRNGRLFRSPPILPGAVANGEDHQ